MEVNRINAVPLSVQSRCATITLRSLDLILDLEVRGRAKERKDGAEGQACSRRSATRIGMAAYLEIGMAELSRSADCRKTVSRPISTTRPGPTSMLLRCTSLGLHRFHDHAYFESHSCASRRPAGFVGCLEVGVDILGSCWLYEEQTNVDTLSHDPAIRATTTAFPLQL